MTAHGLLNILVVDDDDLVMASVRRAFAKGNLENPLFHAEDGLGALDLLRGETLPRDRLVVLLDLNMPRMSGIEFLRELRQDPKLASTAVVVLTASDEERDRVEANRLRVAGYLLKPLDSVAFIQLMEVFNRRWRSMATS
jgi:CheY-like chemotaxis protein